jgi:hypothetical protein
MKQIKIGDAINASVVEQALISARRSNVEEL